MTCTECGKDGATVEKRDASKEPHLFHPDCWLRFAAWLRGEIS